MKKFILILSLILFVGCSGNQTVSLVFNKEITLNRESGTNDYFYCQYCDDYMIGNPSQSKTLYFHNLETGRITQKVELPSINPIRGFFFDGDSSIYFCPNYRAELIEYNIINQTVDTILNITIEQIVDYIKQGMEVGCVIEFLCAPASPLIVDPFFYYIANTVFPERKKEEQIPLLKFAVEKGQVSISTKLGRFPEHYFSEGKTMFPFNFGLTYTLNNKKELVVSHLADHNLYIYDTDGKERVIACKSKYVNKLPELISVNQISDENLMTKREYAASLYMGIYYDVYRNCYYRLVHIATDKDIAEKEGKFAIMILDANFNILAEQLFEKSEYSMIVGCVSEGLLLKKHDDYSGSTKYGLFIINGL